MDKELKKQIKNLTMPKLIISPAENLKLNDKVDVVITETFLGKPRTGKEQEFEIKKSIVEIEKLYKRSFKNISNIMKNGAILVIASPVHIYKNKEFPINIQQIFSQFNLVAKQKPLRYQRKDQFVARDIWIFTKN